MPLPLLQLALLSIMILATAAAMLSALTWIIWRTVSGAPVLPPWPNPARLVPWGGGTILLALFAWAFFNLAVSSTYMLLRSEQRIKVAQEPIVLPLPSPKKAEAASLTDVSAGSPKLSFTEQMLLVSILNGILLIVVPGGVLWITTGTLRDLGLNADHLWRDLRLGILAFLGVTPIVMGINAIAHLFLKTNKHPLEKMLRDEMGPGLIDLAYLSAVLLAPALEELFFRGILQGWLRKIVLTEQASESPDFAETPVEATEFPDPETPAPPLPEKFRLWPRLPTFGRDADAASSLDTGNGSTSRNNLARLLPVIVTSLIFAAVHFEQMPAPLAIFPLSMALGLLYERTESLVASFVLHALFNGFNTTLLVVAVTFGPLAKP